MCPRGFSKSSPSNRGTLASMQTGLIAFLILICLCEQTRAQVRVACIGNSITEGYGLPAGALSYPARLQQLLGSGYSVQNDGASGRTMRKNDTKNSYWKFGKLGQAMAFKPNIVTIKLGTNDANNFAGQWNSISAEFKRDYLAMVDTLGTLATKPRVFVVLPVPIRGNNDSILVKAIALIREVATERHLAIIDAYAPLKGKTELYADNLHPNAAGADTLAHVFYRAITVPVSLPPVAYGDMPGAEASAASTDITGRVSVPIGIWRARFRLLPRR